jgi:hypothetical protein
MNTDKQSICLEFSDANNFADFLLNKACSLFSDFLLSGLSPVQVQEPFDKPRQQEHSSLLLLQCEHT